MCLDKIISGERTIIGVRDYKSYDNPESRLYINDLPGLSLKTAANIASEQYETGAEFLNQSCIMAVRQVFDEFSLIISRYFDFKNIVETRDVSNYKTSTNAPSATERGIVVKRWRSEAARLFIEKVYVKSIEGGDITLKIVDGCTTTEFTATLTADCITEIDTDYKADSESVKIVFDQTGITTYDCAYSSGGGCSSCGGGSYKNLVVKGWDGSSETSGCYGVGVKAHAMCYEENILCSLIPKMYFLIWYKAGIIVLKEHLASNRINHITLFAKDRAQLLLEEYQKEYQDKYKLIADGAYNFLRSTKGECITCNNIRYVQSTP